MKKNGYVLPIILTLIASISCGLPASLVGSATATTAATQTPYVIVVTPTTELSITGTATPSTGIITPTAATATFTLEPTGTTAPTSCYATVKANSNVNVRSGPGTVYEIVGALPQNGIALVDGKNAEGTWWYIQFSGGSGGHAWVAGSVTTATCIPPTLASITAPPTPLPASGTCKDGYVYRLIKASDKICVTPASKAQADADNAAASTRTVLSDYGAATCISGYVWRGAYTGDKVCVTPAHQSQAQSDNAAASSRWTSGAYGSHTCISGYVWREATSGDDVCVTPDVKTQTADDNAAASSRLASAVYGADACKSGYVWREAFSGDHVCVTSEVRTQVQADNAAAPSHTW